MPQSPISTLLLDLDGVIRHFDPDHVSRVEAKHGLNPGQLTATAFSPELLHPAITGVITRAQWQQRIGEEVNSPPAAQEWMAERGKIDAEMMAIVEETRSLGFVVAVLTNGTDTVHQEIRHFGLDGQFDAVFTSWEIGYAKPDPKAFQHVCNELNVHPRNVFFTDDSHSKLAGAIEIGMTARMFRGVEHFKRDLDELVLANT